MTRVDAPSVIATHREGELCEHPCAPCLRIVAEQWDKTDPEVARTLRDVAEEIETMEGQPS